MKVLVLSCNTGGGHNSCGKYIQSEFIANDIPCDFYDYFSLLGKKISHKIEKLYLDSTRGQGKIFKGIYKLGETYNKTGITSPVYELNKLAKNKLINFLQINHYDVVICPHLFPAMAITYLKKEGFPIKLINIATDYTNIPFWNETNPDCFVIPHISLKDEFIQKGIKEEVLLPIGIPVSTKFKTQSRDIAIKNDKPHILVTSGSMGFGKLKNIVLALLKNIDAYIIVICGNNQRLFKSLANINDERLIVKGYVNNMQDYIRKSDIVLTKPGGLTSTEVAILNKPLIHIMPIPGVENYNAQFFASHHLSLVSNSIEAIIQNTKLLLANNNLQAELITQQKNIINPHAAHDLVLFVKKNFK